MKSQCLRERFEGRSHWHRARHIRPKRAPLNVPTGTRAIGGRRISRWIDAYKDLARNARPHHLTKIRVRSTFMQGLRSKGAGQVQVQQWGCQLLQGSERFSNCSGPRYVHVLCEDCPDDIFKVPSHDVLTCGGFTISPLPQSFQHPGHSLQSKP